GEGAQDGAQLAIDALHRLADGAQSGINLIRICICEIRSQAVELFDAPIRHGFEAFETFGSTEACFEVADERLLATAGRVVRRRFRTGRIAIRPARCLGRDDFGDAACGHVGAAHARGEIAEHSPQLSAVARDVDGPADDGVVRIGIDLAGFGGRAGPVAGGR
ncbi:MAG TPA: hypothetical protein VEL28_08415, partial [Candidatus Binatia bacterium]|nr:hypothetical protein [Candidatus Binatia bacterium]